MNYAQNVTEDRRLLILRALANANGYTASALLLHSFLGQFGHNVSHDLVAGDIAWLAEQGLAEQEGNQIAALVKLTMRGLDVANGATHYPGVRRPLPGE